MNDFSLNIADIDKSDNHYIIISYEEKHMDDVVLGPYQNFEVATIFEELITKTEAFSVFMRNCSTRVTDTIDFEVDYA